MGRFELHNAGEMYLNRTNKEYYLDAYEDAAVGFMSTVGAPRTFRLMASVRF